MHAPSRSTAQRSPAVALTSSASVSAYGVVIQPNSLESCRAESWRGCALTDYLLVVVVALVLSMANVVGYTKCSKEASQQLRNLAAQAVSSGFTARTLLASSILSSLACGWCSVMARVLRLPPQTWSGSWRSPARLVLSKTGLRQTDMPGVRLRSMTPHVP